MNEPRKRKDAANPPAAANSEFETQMAMAREIMRKDWKILRALAESDKHG